MPIDPSGCSHTNRTLKGSGTTLDPATGKQRKYNLYVCNNCRTSLSEWVLADDSNASGSGSGDGGTGGCTCVPSSQDPYCPVHGWM